MYSGQSAILALAFGVRVEATLGEVNVDVYGAVLLYALYIRHTQFFMQPS